MTSSLRLRLPPAGTLSPIDEADPLRFYYKPVVGRIFRARIDLGLGFLEGRYQRLLEVGYGSGLLLPTLASIATEVYGVDLEEQPVGLSDTLKRLGVQAHLDRADIRRLPFPDAHFDGVVAFSILEHLKPDQLVVAAAEVARVLQPGGTFVVGCPAVHAVMNAAFSAIGFSGIEHHHFSGIRQILAACAQHFDVERSATLPRLAATLLPSGWAPYTAVLFRRRGPAGTRGGVA